MSDHQHDPILDGLCNPRSHWIIKPGITAACDILTALLAQAREGQETNDQP